MSTTISANVTDVKCDGEAVSGLQSITYRIVRNRQNIHRIGSDERLGVDYGPMYVEGTLTVRSTYPKLDSILVKGQVDVIPFQLVIDLKSSAIGTRKWCQAVKTLTFDECYLEGKDFSMDANGIGLSSYSFTSTRIREQ
jgi:hypothetical protein